MIGRGIAAALLVLLLCGCAAGGDGFDVTETVTPEQIRAMLESAEESLRAAETTAPPLPETSELEPADASDAETVYWSPSGSVWHTDPACASLKQAKSVLSGSVVDAKAAGKARVCRTCGE
ncbi:MAG: hypothetical protein IJX53_02105 [Clostridia bacterium]|nr:hypothetical protein [Clostridia bacterium]